MAGSARRVSEQRREQAVGRVLGGLDVRLEQPGAEQPDLREIDIPFPVVIKPLTRRTDRWTPVGGSGKALRVDTLEALRLLWPRIVAANVPMLAQTLVPGAETDVESYHVYVDEPGDIVAEFTGRKIRTWPTQFGHSTALVITDSADVASAGRAVVRRLDLRGVAKLDFKRGPDGRLYLLEVIPRFTLWHHPAALAGGSGALEPNFPTHLSGLFGVGNLAGAATPWVSYPQLFSARCENVGGASWLNVSDIRKPGDIRVLASSLREPSRLERRLRTYIRDGSVRLGAYDVRWNVRRSKAG